MKVLRLSKVNEVVHLWPFIVNGLESVSVCLKYELSLDSYRKILFRLVKTPVTSWVAVGFDEDIPVAFVVAYECTPMFSMVREFEVSIFYHLPGHVKSINKLQQSFNSFCLTNGVKRYYLTTARRMPEALRHLGEGWSGLRPAYRVFKKTF